MHQVHGTTSAVVGTTDTQTITGKTFGDTSTTFQNTSVNAKKMQFSCSGVTSGQTRILSSPDFNCTLVGSINAPTLNYAITSNGISSAWNQITTSIIGDFSMSNILQNDAIQANVTSVNSITTSTFMHLLFYKQYNI